MSGPKMQDIIDAMIVMNQRFDNTDKKFEGLDQNTEPLKSDMGEVKNDVLALKLDNENVIKSAIQTIAENQTHERLQSNSWTL